MTQTVGGRYAIDGRLGEGGMGCVYRARHLQLGKPFALKLISPTFALDSTARDRFNQEAKLASEITHPNIVSVVDFGEDPQFGAYMVMELVEGEPLLQGGGPMSVRRATDVLGQVADALDHIHKRGIVHGDVKADNIMLAGEASGARRRRIVRLLDFGLARRHATEAGIEEHISGSPHYLAPERVMGGVPSVAADVYALGVLGYLMLTGCLPFERDQTVEVLMAHIHDQPDPIGVRRGEAIDQALDALVMRALAKDPVVRHPTAAAFRYELNTVMDMLDLRRRSSMSMKTVENTASNTPAPNRDAMIVAAFERSRIPQAMCSAAGVIVAVNKAFAALVGERESGAKLEGKLVWDTSLAAFVPGLEHAFKTAANSGKPQEKHARVDRPGRTPLELTTWISPLPIAQQEIHVFVRVEELPDASRR